MAIKSLVAKSSGVDVNLDNSMLPILSLMTILIPLLITNIAFFQLRAIEISTPGTVFPLDQEIPPSVAATKAVMLQFNIHRLGINLQLIDEATGGSLVSRDFKHKKKDLDELQTQVVRLRQRYHKLETVLVTVDQALPYRMLMEILARSKGQPSTKEVLKDQAASQIIRSFPKPLNVVLLPKGGI